MKPKAENIETKRFAQKEQPAKLSYTLLSCDARPNMGLYELNDSPAFAADADSEKATNSADFHMTWLILP